MKKRYVQEKVERDSDGKKLQVVKVLDSKPKKFKYIVFDEN